MSARDLMHHAIEHHGAEAMLNVEQMVDAALKQLDTCPALEIVVLASILVQRLRPGAVDVETAVELVRGANLGWELSKKTDVRAGANN